MIKAQETPDIRLHESREAYQEKMDARFQAIGSAFDHLKEKAPHVGDDMRQEFDQQIAELEEKQAEAHQQLQMLQASSQEMWQEFAEGVETAWKDLADHVEHAVKRFSL